jgi:tRNA threonylcarbamoyladenosine biosynthesis protein TsaB
LLIGIGANPQSSIFNQSPILNHESPILWCIVLILALDTTTRAASVALAREDCVIEEAASDPARPTATRLPGDLIALLDRHGVALHDVDVFAVATGPGSFTGLRIGIATMQGLAFANRKPLIGVSGFDALAAIAAVPDIPYVATWVDAWRGEVYAALYEIRPSECGPDSHANVWLPAVAGRCAIEPTVDTPDSVLAGIREYITPAAVPHVRFAGDGAVMYRDAIATHLGAQASIAEPGTPLLAGAIARVAAAAAAGGERPLPHAIRPLYIRRPDAELARSRARGLTHSS